MGTYASAYLLIGSLYLLAAASPGPNFFIISQLALRGDRALALQVTSGIVLGSAVWVSAAAAGLATLLLHYGALATALVVWSQLLLGLRVLRREWDGIAAREGVAVLALGAVVLGGWVAPGATPRWISTSFCLMRVVT